MSSEAKQVAPGGFFLHFQNSSQQNHLVYKFKKAIILPRGYIWKVAVTNCSMIQQTGTYNLILCSDIVCKSHINGEEIRVLFSSASCSDIQNADVTPLYVSVADERVGVPITEINFQLKSIDFDQQRILDVQLQQYGIPNISGWLHFKSENISCQH